MIRRDDLSSTMSDWFDEQAGRAAPDYLDDVLDRTIRTRQRPAWSSLERWLPVQTLSIRLVPVGRVAWALVVLALILALAAALVLLGPGQRRLPHFGSEANGSIVFVDGTDLKVAGPDGLNVRLGATLPNGVDLLRYSPDGTRLAYRTTASPAALVVALADGTQPVVVSNGLAVAKPSQAGPAGGGFAWSPDSRRLAFAWTASADRRSIDIVDADGSHLTPLVSGATGPATDQFDPAWSPDGKWISFFATEAPGTAAINIVHPDGTGARRLPTSPVNVAYLEMTWAPDPAQVRLEYVSGAPETGNDVQIFDVATSKETQVGSGFFGTWAPDAGSIAWWDDTPGSPGSPNAGGIRVAKVASILGGVHSPIAAFLAVNNLACHDGVASSVGFCGPAGWSPDSRWIFGPDPSGSAIVLTTIDLPRIAHTIRLDHRVDISNGPQSSLAWQPIAP